MVPVVFAFIGFREFNHLFSTAAAEGDGSQGIVHGSDGGGNGGNNGGGSGSGGGSSGGVSSRTGGRVAGVVFKVMEVEAVEVVAAA